MVGYRNHSLASCYHVADVDRNLQWHRAVSLRLCNSMALVDRNYVSLSFKHFKMRNKNARKCTTVKPI